MPEITSEPTTVKFFQGDTIFYEGTCTMSIGRIRSDGKLGKVTRLLEDHSYTIPVTANYSVSASGACCEEGSYVVYADECCSGGGADAVGGYQTQLMCDPKTGTLWTRIFSINRDKEVVVLQDWTDSGRACAEPDIIVDEFCLEDA